MSRPLKDRAYDVVLWGATGFTGRLVAEELLRRYRVKGSLRWALAGRNHKKLEELRASLTGIDPEAGDLALVVADANDVSSLGPMVESTRVVATTVGPFAKYGHELAAACANAGTSYCDLTGEPHFVRDSIDRNHARAKETGARIVHACGFDSIPSDLGVYMMQTYAKKQGTRCKRIDMFVARAKGGFSGGTVASMLEIAELSSSRDFRRKLANPYLLDPDPSRSGPDKNDQMGVRVDEATGRWTAPFLMAVINTRIVRRTNALFGYAWGEDFRYGEAMSFARGPRGLMMASAVTGALGGFMGALGIGPLRKLLADRVLPAPGEGPSAKERAAGSFLVRHHAELENGERAVGLVGDDYDPGYGSTARMFSEAAVCLAKDALASEGGVLTPAFAMREHYLERARAIGMTFSVEAAPVVSA